MKRNFVFFALLGAMFAAMGADPTRLSPVVGEVLKAQLEEFRALEIRGLVARSASNAVAVVTTADDPTLRVARKGATITLSASGVPFPVKVVDVGVGGVSLAAETLDSSWTIPVAFARSQTVTDDTNLLAIVEFEGLTLKTALRLLADQSGSNFVCTEASADVPVTLFLRDVTVGKTVDELCKSHRLWYRADGESGIIRIVTMEEFKDSLTGYQQEELIETFTLLYPNVSEVASIIQGVYADRVRLTLGDEDILDDELSDLGRRFERFQAISDSSGSSDLMGNFSSVNSASRSLGSYARRGGGRYSSGGGLWLNNGMIREAAEERRQARELVDFRTDEASRLQPMLAEGASNAVVAAALQDSRYQPPSVFVTVSRRSNMLVVRTGDPRIMEEIRKLVAKVDVPTPMVYLELEIMRLELDDGINSVFDWNLKDIVSGGKYGVEIDGTTAFSPSAPGTITFSLVSKHIESHVKLQRERGKLKSIATPSLLTAHNEVSQFFMGEEVPIVRNITAAISQVDRNSVIVPQTEIEWRKVGTRLLITPSINADRTVTLRLMQETSTRHVDGGTILATGVATNSSSAQVVSQKFSVDTIESKSIAGTFIAQDEMAVVAGGMIEEEESDKVSGIPLLMDIPWLGWFFRSTEKVKRRSEVVIYMKPHVISTPGDTRRATEAFTAARVRNPLADEHRSEDDLARQRQDRNEARREQQGVRLLPDVNTFHIK